MDLENSALRWLAWEKKCIAVLHERQPRYHMGTPDVLGLTRARYLIEVEVKRSVSDFKANSQKHCVLNREHFKAYWPRQFYFFVPETIVQKCEHLTPEWAGLAKLVDGVRFEVVKPAPVNHESKRLTTKECVKFFHLLSNQVVSQSNVLLGYHRQFQWGHDPYFWTYEI